LSEGKISFYLHFTSFHEGGERIQRGNKVRYKLRYQDKSQSPSFSLSLSFNRSTSHSVSGWLTPSNSRVPRIPFPFLSLFLPSLSVLSPREHRPGRSRVASQAGRLAVLAMPHPPDSRTRGCRRRPPGRPGTAARTVVQGCCTRGCARVLGGWRVLRPCGP
jgi:hypothetical protein